MNENIEGGPKESPRWSRNTIGDTEVVGSETLYFPCLASSVVATFRETPRMGPFPSSARYPSLSFIMKEDGQASLFQRRPISIPRLGRIKRIKRGRVMRGVEIPIHLITTLQSFFFFFFFFVTVYGPDGLLHLGQKNFLDALY